MVYKSVLQGIYAGNSLWMAVLNDLWKQDFISAFGDVTYTSLLTRHLLSLLAESVAPYKVDCIVPIQDMLIYNVHNYTEKLMFYLESLCLKRIQFDAWNLWQGALGEDQRAVATSHNEALSCSLVRL